MPYDEALAELVRRVAGDVDGEVTERKMFGGLTFPVNGAMFAGVVGGELVVRLGEAGAQAALTREHVREMDFTGRPMRTMVYIEAEGLNGADLDEWVTAAASFALSPSRSKRR